MDNELKISRWKKPSTYWGIALLILFGWTAIAGIYSGYAWEDSRDPETHIRFNLSDYFREAGFDPTVDYPVQLGGTADGASGSIDGSVSVFLGSGGGSVSGELTPAASVKMVLPFEDSAGIMLVVPSDRIVFHTDGVTNARVHFGFNEVMDYAVLNDKWSYAPGDSFMKFSKPIREEIQPGIQDSYQWTEFTDVPLQQQILDNVGRIDLYLTQEQLDDLLA